MTDYIRGGGLCEDRGGAGAVTTGFCKTCERRAKCSPSYPRQCKLLVRDRGGLGVSKPCDFWTDNPNWEREAEEATLAYVRRYFHAPGG